MFKINIRVGIAPERMRLRLRRLIDKVLAVVTVAAATVIAIVH